MIPLEEEEEEDESPFPTLEEAAAMVQEKKTEDIKAELETVKMFKLEYVTFY